MFTTNITIDNVLPLITKAVEQRGKDFVAGEGGTAGCYLRTVDYMNLVPHCIVAQVFSNLGILRAVLTGDGYDQHGACSISSDIWTSAEEMGVFFDADAREVLYAAQNVQDSPRPWGEALTAALDAAQTIIRERAEKHTVFTTQAAAVKRATSESEEPLAEWEKELLGVVFKEGVKVRLTNSETPIRVFREVGMTGTIEKSYDYPLPESGVTKAWVVRFGPDTQIVDQTQMEVIAQ